MSDAESVVSLKVLFIGPKKCGKSAFTERLISGLYNPIYKPTFG